MQNIYDLHPKSVCSGRFFKYINFRIFSDQRNNIPLKWSIQTEYGVKQIFAALHSLWWRRGSWLDCGSIDLGSIPGIPSPHVGPLMAVGKRHLLTSRCPCPGRLSMLKTPSCPWRWVPGSRSIFGNWTTVPSLYSWNIAECDVKSPRTNQPTLPLWWIDYFTSNEERPFFSPTCPNLLDTQSARCWSVITGIRWRPWDNREAISRSLVNSYRLQHNKVCTKYLKPITSTCLNPMVYAYKLTASLWKPRMLQNSIIVVYINDRPHFRTCLKNFARFTLQNKTLICFSSCNILRQSSHQLKGATFF